METNQKLMTLLRLMDEPEAMTEAQLQELLADDEVREAYELMADCKRVYQKEKTQQIQQTNAQPLPKKEWSGYYSTWRKVAAVFFVAAFLGGLSFAAYRVFAPQTNSPQPAQVATPSLQGRAEGGPVRFSDIRLDSILTVVAAHYGKTVCFRNEEPRSMKLITTWNPEDSLSSFIEHINMFDYVHLTLKDDTIFVTADTLPAPPQGGE